MTKKSVDYRGREITAKRLYKKRAGNLLVLSKPIKAAVVLVRAAIGELEALEKRRKRGRKVLDFPAIPAVAACGL
jgi:hypothetical protein